MFKYAPGSFLDLPESSSNYANSKVVILPLPYEESVSYGAGTAEGPSAIINASQQVELYDRHFSSEPALLYGIHTLSVPSFFSKKTKLSPATLLTNISDIVKKHKDAGKFILALGGEHTLSSGVFSGLAASISKPLTVVHIDAHADLRDSYQDNPYSHACVLRRIAEHPLCEQILQFGIRSLCSEQAKFIATHSDKNSHPFIKTWFPENLEDKKWEKKFSELLSGKNVFFTFDVDGLDPTIIPSTGTPEPNGLVYSQVLKIAEIISCSANSCVGMDCLELAPIRGVHYPEFTIAKLLYSILNTFFA